jgi:hypothetical protein
VASNALHGVISQKKILFKTTAVKISNPTTFFIVTAVKSSNSVENIFLFLVVL